MKKIILLFILPLLVFIACEARKKEKQLNLDSSDSDKLVITQMVESWNNANLTKNIGDLSNMYAESVNFYGKVMRKNECLKNKISFFEKNPSFSQTIENDIVIEQVNEQKMKSTFTKKVYVNNIVKYYPSYLEFVKESDNWKIITEGDLITDKNLSTKNNSEAILSCEDAIISICKTSPLIKKQLKKDIYIEVDRHEEDSYFIHIYGVNTDATYTLGWYEYNAFSNKLYNTMSEEEMDFDRNYGATTVKMCK